MSVAPIHGRPAPLVFMANEREKWPRYRPGKRLSTRARRRKWRRERRAMIMAAFGLIAVAVIVILRS